MAQSRLRPWEEPVPSENLPKIEMDPCSSRPNHTSSPSSVSQDFSSKPSPSQATLHHSSTTWTSDSQTGRVEPVTSKRRRTEDVTGDNVYHLNGECCPPTCTGLHCTKIREMTGNVTYEIETHEHLVHGSSIKDRFKDSHQTVPVLELIREIANRLHHSNTELRKLLESNVMAGLLAKPLPPSSSITAPTLIERRASGSSKLESSKATLAHQEQQDLHAHGEHRSPKLQSYQPQLSHHHITSQQILGPGHAPPSPVSLQTSIPPPLSSSLSLPPSASPPAMGTTLPSTSNVPAAHAAHLQDLQHQLAVKSLTHSSLQSEYDTLLKVLERQRVKCSTLERKFHVSDAEIVALANEKERLEQVVEAMEKQARDLQKSRDEARKQGAEATGQYLRIVQMAGRLHSGATGGTTTTSGAEDGASLLDREALLKRVEELEGQLEVRRRDGASELNNESSELSDSGDGSGKSHMDWLEEEVKRLRIRNTRLENGLIAAKQAAITLAAHGQNVGTVLSKALEEPN